MEIQSDDNSAAAHRDHPVVGMDAALKAKWVEALRSGEFKQCRGYLTDGQAFCCLGVGATVADLPLFFTSIDTGKRLGLTVDQAETLIDMNDGTAVEAGYGFSEIADYIDQHIPARPNGERTASATGSEVA